MLERTAKGRDKVTAVMICAATQQVCLDAADAVHACRQMANLYL
jgi:hypothetical protein